LKAKIYTFFKQAVQSRRKAIIHEAIIFLGFGEYNYKLYNGDANKIVF